MTSNSLTQKSAPNPSDSMNRVHASSQYVSQCALKTTPCPSTSAYRTRIRWRKASLMLAALSAFGAGPLGHARCSAGYPPHDARSCPQLGGMGGDDRVDRGLAKSGDVVVGERAI